MAATTGPDAGAAPSHGTRLEVPALIARKRDGGELTPDEVQALVAGYLDDRVDDAQMAALLMAGVLRGFTRAEAIALTGALVASGATVDLDGLRGPTIDKHSTGGVGDTTTLVVAPLLAAAGCQVPKLSGRGLGHTGGTLDKLESIPGFRVELRPDELRAQVERIGIALAAASADLVPADRRLYALRDVTATVPSPALIASSVMSKKLAAGARHVLLDVKVGDGAFLPDAETARELAELCAQIGEAHGRRTAALVTDMSQPLGDAVGNALEVGAAIEVLRGERGGRLRELSLELVAAGLELVGSADAAQARSRAVALLDSGAGLEKFREVIVAQGGDPEVLERPWDLLPSAPIAVSWVPCAGFVARIGCRRLGELAAQLGAGRRRQGDVLDLAVGLDVRVRTGEPLDGATPAVVVHARTRADADRVVAQLDEVIEVGDAPVASPPLVQARVGFAPG